MTNPVHSTKYSLLALRTIAVFLCACVCVCVSTCTWAAPIAVKGHRMFAISTLIEYIKLSQMAIWQPVSVTR